jgi:hypothetical protein
LRKEAVEVDFGFDGNPDRIVRIVRHDIRRSPLS